MVRGMRFQLRTKSISSPPTGDGLNSNPALQQRPGNVVLDEGRQWSGDLYTQGAVTDPEEAYGHYKPADGEDVEAWLDKAEDGTLVGWVREGEDVYRYIDPEAWGEDVDGAQMERVDAGPAPVQEDPLAAEGEVAPAGDGTEVDPTEEDPSATPDDDDPATRSIGEQAPDAFEDETDEATTEEDPTDGLEDPTELSPSEGDGGDEADDAFSELLRDDVDAQPAAADDAPAEADPAEDPADAPAEETAPAAEADPAEEEETITVSPDDLPKIDGDPAEESAEDPAEETIESPAEESAESAEGEDDEDDEDEKKKLGLQHKHMPGKHNQDDHGNWADHVHIGGHKPRGLGGGKRSDDSDGSSGSGGAASAPKGEPAKPATPSKPDQPKAPETEEPVEPSKAELDKDTIKAMSDGELESITEDPRNFGWATMEAAAQELDERHDAEKALREKFGDTEPSPGSPEEAAAFDAVIPPLWAAWAGTAGKLRGQKVKSKKAEVEDAWMLYHIGLAKQAETATNGHMLAKRTEREFMRRYGTTDALFDGRIARSQMKRWISQELAEWLDEHGMTKRQFLAEYYPSYAKLLREVGLTALSENG